MKTSKIFLITLIFMLSNSLMIAGNLPDSHQYQETYLERLKSALEGQRALQTISQGEMINEVGVNYLGSYLWHGMKDLEIRGNYAYCTFQQGMMQIDISDPANPVMKSSLDQAYGEAWGLDFYDNYVLVAYGSEGLSIGQIDENEDVRFINQDPALNPALDVYVQDSIIYLAQGYQGLDILSNFSPDGYLSRGHLTTQNAVIKVVAQGDFAYLADGSGGLQIVNIADLDNPELAGSVGNLGFALDLALTGKYAYVAIENVGFAIINIADPYNPRLIKIVSSTDGINGIAIAGYYAYTTYAGLNGLLIYDINLPENPVLIGKQEMPGTALAVKIYDNKAFLAGWQSGLNIIDISTNQTPELIGRLESPGAIHTVQSDLLTTYVATSAWQVGHAGFHIIDWQEIGIPKLFSTFRIEGADIYDFAVQADYAYLADFENGLVILDIRNHENPIRIGSYPINGESTKISLSGDLACLVTDQGLQIIRVADPSLPHLVYQYQPQSKIADLKLVNKLAFIGMNGFGMEILNLDNPDQPEIIGGYYNAFKIKNIDVAGNYVYLTDADSGFITVDISDLSRPTRASRHDLENNNSSSIYYADSYIHITNPANGITFFNVRDNLQSYLAAVYPTRGIARDFTTVTNVGFIADYYGLSLVTLEKPVIAISQDEINFTAYENGIDPASEYIDVSNIGGGTLSWNATADSDWISLIFREIIGNNFTAGIEVGAHITGLSDGIYYDTITIISNATNAPTLVPVSLELKPANSAPQIDGLENRFIKETETVNFIVSSSDEEGTIPILKAGPLPVNASFIDNLDGTGLFEFTPSYEQAGQYSITFYATENNDPLLTDSATMNITVENLNRPPMFTPYYADTVIVEDDSLNLLIQVTDPDNELVIMKAFNLPENAQFIYTDTIGATATLIFTPDYTQVGEIYPLEIRAVDYYDAQISDTINLTVANRQLEIIDFQAAPPISGIKDILLADSIMIVMNEAIIPESLDEYFTVSGAKSTQFNYGYDPETFTIKIKPFETEFEKLDTIWITLFAGLLDLAGQPLGQDVNHTVYTGTVIHPGDTDNDGSVDERDILPLGIYYYQIGPIRNDLPDCGWGRFLVHQWELLGSTYADADGSGQVDGDDICAISQNWNNTHDESISAGQRLAEIKAHLKKLDENILIDLYDNLINCDENEGKKILVNMLQSMLGQTRTLPLSYELNQNYPNPFNPLTSISYALPEKTFVSIQIYDILGRQVTTLVNDVQEAGYYSRVWDGTDYSGQAVASGVYFYKLQSTHSTLTKKMLLLK